MIPRQQRTSNDSPENWVVAYTRLASTLERRSLLFTVRKERSEDQRSESFGARLPDHTVRLCLAETIGQWGV